MAPTTTAPLSDPGRSLLKHFLWWTTLNTKHASLKALTPSISQLRHLTAEVTPSYQNKDVLTDGASRKMDCVTQR